jgi:hypothetical protein
MRLVLDCVGKRTHRSRHPEVEAHAEADEQRRRQRDVRDGVAGLKVERDGADHDGDQCDVGSSADPRARQQQARRNSCARLSYSQFAPRRDVNATFDESKAEYRLLCADSQRNVQSREDAVKKRRPVSRFANLHCNTRNGSQIKIYTLKTPLTSRLFNAGSTRSVSFATEE